MSEFMVGEVAILCNMPNCPEWNGREVVITGPLQMRLQRVLTPTPHYEQEMAYLIEGGWLRKTEKWSIGPQHLKRKAWPREPLGKWEECPWKPVREFWFGSE